jgi:hypothetical protein
MDSRGMQNERYDLSKQVESITAQYTTGRVSWVWRLHVTDKSGNVHTLFANDQKELEDTVGKELGDKIFNDVHYKHAEKNIFWP